VNFRDPSALAEVFARLLEKEGVTVERTKPAGAPTATADLTLRVGVPQGSLQVRTDPVVKRFQARSPRLTIKMEGQDPPVVTYEDLRRLPDPDR
jgi:DNA-binding transcriptional LysR family regulator